MEELLFYTVDRNYIRYLSEFESHISYNKDEIGHSRPYLGIVLRIEKYEYFVPLYSYKKHYEKYKNNPSFFFVSSQHWSVIYKYLLLKSPRYI